MHAKLLVLTVFAMVISKSAVASPTLIAFEDIQFWTPVQYGETHRLPQNYNGLEWMGGWETIAG